jgi:hypothetical protein
MQEPSKAGRSASAASPPNVRLSAKDVAQLRAIAATANARIGARRKALLFDGKSAAAAAVAMAKQLHRDLFRIDLSAVVSRFIGETEKNLARVIAEARTRDAILLFDEADTLFGKRTGVTDAHDRFSNLELDHLLRAMTEHAGLAVLVSKPRLRLSMMLQRRVSVYEFSASNATSRKHVRSRSPSRIRR